jgi:molecular chaperone GrpE
MKPMTLSTTEETADATSSESETDAVLDKGDTAEEGLDDVPCSDAGLVEEELICLDESLSALEERLAEAESKAAEYLDGWQRTQASFANYRKRTEAEQAYWRSTANANLLSRLLPILDDFKRAFDALPEIFEGHSWLSGIMLIQRKVRAILDSESVTAITLNPGDPFDPLYHQAVVYQEVEGFTDGQIVAEIETGYMLGERVLRPSMVVVAKAPVRAISIVEGQQSTEAQSDGSTVEIIEGEVISSDPEETSPDTTGDAGAA